jgi:lipopolysaccharide biosynthesis regulator YciM
MSGMPDSSPRPSAGALGILQPTGSADPRARVELPPDELAPRRTMSESSIRFDEATKAIVGQQKRRTTLAVGAIVAIVLLLIGIGAVRAIGKRKGAPPADAVASRDAAMTLLRRDDTGSKKQAVKSLDALTTQHPEYVEGHAARVIALSLLLDDERIEAKRLESEAVELNRKIARLKESRTGADWEGRVNRMIEQLEGIKKRSDPLVDEVQAIDQSLSAARRLLPGEPAEEDRIAVVRAHAIYFGVKGSSEALTRAEEYRTLTATQPDGWGTIALAEYAVSARVSPETLEQSRKALDELKANDSTFLRTYVLLARLAMVEKKHEAAASSLESVLLLNPNHDVAKKLLEWAQDSQRTRP